MFVPINKNTADGLHVLRKLIRLIIPLVTSPPIPLLTNPGQDSHIQILNLAQKPAVAYTPLVGTTYDPVTGDLVLRIGTHIFGENDYIRIADNSLTFTCNFNSDGNTTQKTYPRSMNIWYIFFY